MLGLPLLRDARQTKFTAFSLEERDELCLHGLLPAVVETQDEQMQRELAILRGKQRALDKYAHLMSLLDRNERLFYYLALHNVEEIVPLVYTPVVGEACVKYSALYSRPRGLFITINDLGRVDDIIKNYASASSSKVKAIVVTDGERILGLGDQGCNGMGIPVGKLQLYVAMGGIHPCQTLPVTLDVGTDNKKLLEDAAAQYIGLKQQRERGPKYDQLVDEFVRAVRSNFGARCLIQWEDFGTRNAFRLLERYRDVQLSFNDDIQGTASVVLAAVLASLRLTGQEEEDNKLARLADHTFVFFGAGEAGVGIAELIASAIARESNCTMTKEQARQRIWLVDSKGLVHQARFTSSTDEKDKHKLPFAHKLGSDEDGKHDDAGTLQDLAGVCRMLRATALIGVSAQPNVFTQPVCEQMAKNCQRPLIFALSNPTDKAECTAEQAIKWTDGQCLFCSGSPFPDVDFAGKQIRIGQANNSYIFPGLALGLLAVDVTSVPDEMFECCAQTLANQVSMEDLQKGSLFPRLSGIRRVSAKLAASVAERAYELGLAKLIPRPADLLVHCVGEMYCPDYGGVNCSPDVTNSSKQV